MSRTKTATSSFPLFGILGLIFVTLKLAQIGVVANWSWWLVLLPFYGPLAFVLCAAVLVGLGYCLMKAFGK